MRLGLEFTSQVTCRKPKRVAASTGISLYEVFSKMSWFLKRRLRAGTKRYFSCPPGSGSCIGRTRTPAVPRRFLRASFRSRRSAVRTVGMASVWPSVPATIPTKLLRSARSLRTTNNYPTTDHDWAGAQHHWITDHNRGEALSQSANSFTLHFVQVWKSSILTIFRPDHELHQLRTLLRFSVVLFFYWHTGGWSPIGFTRHCGH
jgi:hypothetical protein